MKKILRFSLIILFMVILSSCNSFKYEHIVDEHWSYNEEFHWKYITCSQDRCKIEFATYEHVDDDLNNICDICDYFILKQETAATTSVDEDETVLFNYKFSVGDKFKFSEKNIYVNASFYN